MDPSRSVLGRLSQSFSDGAGPAEAAIQCAVAAGAIAFAYYVARFFCTRIRLREHWKFGKGDFERVAFAWASVLFVWIAKLSYQAVRGGDGGPLELIGSLLLVWAFIRIGSYVLGHVIPDGGFQRAVIRLFNAVVWIAVVLHLTGLLPDVLSALDAHGIQVGKDKREVTLLDFLQGCAALFLAVVMGLWISRVTEGRLMAAGSMEMTTRVVMTKIVKIAILVVAVFVALPIAGIDITTLSIFSGAVGVGLGFGLQKIASNYVSGFIVLLDRSLRIGDVVTVDNKRGEVKDIRSRYTVVKGADGVETIIPNEKFVTDSVQHHTYSDPKVSVQVGVTVAYESDVELACALLAEAAKRHKRVIADPPVSARVKQFTDRGVELELTVWIEDPAVGEGDLRSDLLIDILRVYKERGIAMPYPRRDLHLIATPETRDSSSRSAG
jgi:small-conductance mechanosensitive channel